MEPKPFTLSVIIPVYNEFGTLKEILSRVKAVQLPEGGGMEIVVVDDYSTDGTRTLYPEIRRQVDRVLLHKKNQGKGAAIRTGLKFVTGDFVIIQDADLEYNPNEYLTLLPPLLDGRADVVYGSRFLGGSQRRVLYFWHTVGNRFLTLLSNMRTDLNLTDMETCYKMFRRSILEGVEIEQNRFGFEPEITGKLAQRDVRFYEVGISYDGRTYEEGKKIGWKDAVQAIYCIWKYSRGRYRDVGKQTLQRLETFDEYIDWIFDHIEEHLGDRVIEIGSGTGALGRRIAPRERVCLTDLRDDYIEKLETKFRSYPTVEVRRVDALAPPPDLTRGEFDTALSSNVVEHIEDDVAAVRAMASMVAPGGRVVLLLPAFESLMSPLDENLGHHRRYTRETMTELFRKAGLAVERADYMNFVGGCGWFIAGKVFRQSSISLFSIRLHKVVQPAARLIERWAFGNHPPFGLSVIGVARKPK